MAKKKVDRPTVTDTNAPQPLGVYPGYSVPSSGYPSDPLGRQANQQVDAGLGFFGAGVGYFQGPRYYEGAELSPASAPMDQIIALQNQLEAMGLLGQHTVGLWDDASASAYGEALGIANRQGITIEQLLGSGAVNSKGGAGSGSAAPKLPSPEDVKALLNDAAYKQIGKNLDTAALDAGVQAFYNAYKPSGQYQAPDPSTIADSYLKSSMPEEVQAHGQTRVYDVFEKMLGGLG